MQILRLTQSPMKRDIWDDRTVASIIRAGLGGDIRAGRGRRGRHWCISRLGCHRIRNDMLSEVTLRPESRAPRYKEGRT